MSERAADKQVQTAAWVGLKGFSSYCILLTNSSCDSAATQFRWPTTMGLVGCSARLLTDMVWPLNVFCRLALLTSIGAKVMLAIGLSLGPACMQAIDCQGICCKGQVLDTPAD